MRWENLKFGLGRNIFPLVLLSFVAAGSGDFSNHDGRGSIDPPLLFTTVEERRHRWFQVQESRP
ncbi:hypothetical protein V6Z12_D02G198700 [Gossypium hirsutum]